MSIRLSSRSIPAPRLSWEGIVPTLFSFHEILKASIVSLNLESGIHRDPCLLFAVIASGLGLVARLSSFPPMRYQSLGS